MAETNIEWTDRVWNPVRGCTRVSEGCRNCYAERQAIRQSGIGKAYFGLVRSHEVNRGSEVRHEPRWTGKIALGDASRLAEPLSWRKPSYVFVNSMSDLFHADVPFEFIDEVFHVMSVTPEHTYQILTKRPERMLEYVTQRLAKKKQYADKFDLCPTVEMRNSPAAIDSRRDAKEIPSHIWLGTSVENQETADQRIPLLLETPAAVRWVSAEPLLGPIRLDECAPYVLGGDESNPCVMNAFNSSCHHPLTCMEAPKVKGNEKGIQWVVVGGESGPGARPCNVQWIRSIVQQCQAAEIPVFVKQLGAMPMISPENALVEIRNGISDRKGGCISDFPPDLQVRQYPEVR